MPIYEYRCLDCSYTFEEIQKFNDPPITVCPKCGGKVEKLISAPAIQFKGSGWYITDYAKKNTTENKKFDNNNNKIDDKKEGSPKNKGTSNRLEPPNP